ncbi:MAG: rhomboid family intramembrane serine protease [Alistipes sp.]|nr:rhomboid family intramembrane serine protease [Alistipes sp.]
MSFFRTDNQTPPVVLNLMIANAVVFLATMLFDDNVLYGNFALFNVDFRCIGQEGMTLFRPWQLFTYMFMHGGFSHLFFNMFSLWMFGRTLEMQMGWKRFLIYYIVCGVGAALFQMAIAQIDLAHLDVGSFMWVRYMQTPTVGASGAIFGLLLAFGMLYPDAIISLIFPPISMKAKWFVIVYGVLELLLGVSGTMSGVAHFAHLGGMFWGWLLLSLWQRMDRNRNYYY